MPDIVDPATRSWMMSRIRGKDTRPELVVRRGLHALGYRFRLHRKTLPGRPDLVLPKYSAAIFVNGCFWHAHDCHLFRMPSTRTGFWEEKISRNRTRDAAAHKALSEAGWRVLDIWECALKGRTRLEPGKAVEQAAHWLDSSAARGVIRGYGETSETRP